MRCPWLTIVFLLPLVCASASESSKPAGIGSGFAIHPEGWVLTAAHVVRGCPRINVVGIGTAEEVVADQKLDIALLKVSQPLAHWLAFSINAEPGDAVTVSRLQAAGTQWQRAMPILAKVTSTQRHDGDRRYVQLDASLRAGESGAPVVDNDGNVVGLVVARLTPGAAYRLTGNPRQAVAYAVDAEALLDFVAPTVRLGEDVAPSVNTPRLGHGQLLIECWYE